MSWVSSRNASGGKDEAQKAAKWLMRHTLKVQEESDAQTVFLLNLLTEHRQELEARDNVMRDSSVLVSKLQMEVQVLKEQLSQRDAKLSALQRLVGIDDTPASSSCGSSVGGGTDGGSSNSSIVARRQRCLAHGVDACHPAGSGGGWDTASTHRPPHTVPCTTLHEAWARLRRGSEAPVAPSATSPVPACLVESPASIGEPSFSPATPCPRNHLAMRLSSASYSSTCSTLSLSTAPSVDGGTQERPLQEEPQLGPHQRQASVAHPSIPRLQPASQIAQQSASPPAPSQHQELRQQTPLPPAPPPPPQHQTQLPQPSSPPPLPQSPPPASRSAPIATQTPPPPPPGSSPSVSPLVSSLQTQLDAARREAAEATSNYLTCRKDLEILHRKYDSLMLQKLEAEEQRDRLFSPGLDVALIRAAMPAVDAALELAEGRLAAAAETLAAFQAEAEDAARVQNQQRRKWISRLEAVQAQLEEREARVSELEAQLAEARGQLGLAATAMAAAVG